MRSPSPRPSPAGRGGILRRLFRKHALAGGRQTDGNLLLQFVGQIEVAHAGVAANLHDDRTDLGINFGHGNKNFLFLHAAFEGEHGRIRGAMLGDFVQQETVGLDDVAGSHKDLHGGALITAFDAILREGHGGSVATADGFRTTSGNDERDNQRQKKFNFHGAYAIRTTPRVKHVVAVVVAGCKLQVAGFVGVSSNHCLWTVVRSWGGGINIMSKKKVKSI